MLCESRAWGKNARTICRANVAQRFFRENGQKKAGLLNADRPIGFD
jgi:hypothetical protein